jgi:cytoskeletal protein CcmA (bactofilin family)
MFRKPTNSLAAPGVASGAAPPSLGSIIGRELVIEGALRGDGDVHVEGVILGDVRVQRLSIGETGYIEGAITAESIESRGRVIGQITAKQVRLLPAAFVDGDIIHDELVIEAGAYFQGRSLKFQRHAPPRIAGAVEAGE